MKFLRVDILRASDGYDCTNGGVTSENYRVNGKAPQFVIPCERGPITEEDVARAGYVVLVFGEAGGRMHLKPAESAAEGRGKWYMFGGNFAYSNDSRFSSINNGCPIHIHDRTES